MSLSSFSCTLALYNVGQIKITNLQEQKIQLQNGHSFQKKSQDEHWEKSLILVSLFSFLSSNCPRSEEKDNIFH